MRILHVGLVGPFNDDMAYQGSILPKENKKAGHEVIVITSCYKWSENQVIKVPEEDRIKDGIRYIRIEYDRIISPVITEKIRKAKTFKKYLDELKPDIIFNHDLQTFELLTLKNYKKNNPKVKIYADSHSDKHNSANNWFSLNLMHRFFYKTIIQNAIGSFERILYISYEVKEFLCDTYDIPDNILEFYPLGGTILPFEEKSMYRKEKRVELGLSEHDIVFCHSGKMDSKKRTYELLYNFNKVKNKNLRLIIIGVFSEELQEKIMQLINEDNRVLYLGWKSSDELIKYIAASDLYVQPGSQSATMQSSLCSGTPVLFTNVESHKSFMKGNAFMINEPHEMEAIFYQIIEDPSILREMSQMSYKLAYELLDYKKMAEKIANV